MLYKLIIRDYDIYEGGDTSNSKLLFVLSGTIPNFV